MINLRMKKQNEQREEERADLLDDNCKMKFKLKSIGNFKKKYKRKKTLYSKLDYRLKIQSQKLQNQCMLADLNKNKAEGLELKL